MAKKGYKHTAEAKRKISLARKGRKHSEIAKLKISSAHKGIKLSEEHKKKISLSKKGVSAGNKNYFFGRVFKGESNWNWKGDDVGYRAMHRWVEKWKGKPDTCEKCGQSGLNGHKIHWANISHTYCRVLDDWIRLCVKCHKTYDKVNKQKS